jgi:XisI protein
MENLRQVVETEVTKYAGKGLNTMGYVIHNDVHNLIGVIDIATIRGERIVDTGLLVRLVDDLVIIEKDINSDPLHEALMQAGVPRSQIVLAYAGESVAIEN